jgi:hypothetical protein
MPYGIDPDIRHPMLSELSNTPYSLCGTIIVPRWRSFIFCAKNLYLTGYCNFAIGVFGVDARVTL